MAGFKCSGMAMERSRRLALSGTIIMGGSREMHGVRRGTGTDQEQSRPMGDDTESSHDDLTGHKIDCISKFG